jgi:hypothetical protein
VLRGVDLLKRSDRFDLQLKRPASRHSCECRLLAESSLSSNRIIIAGSAASLELPSWNDRAVALSCRFQLLQSRRGAANFAALSVRVAMRPKNLMQRVQLPVALREKILKAAFPNMGWRRFWSTT